MYGYSLYKFEGMYNVIKNKDENSWFIIEDGKVFYEYQCSWKEFSQKIKLLKTKKSNLNSSTLSWHCYEYRDTSMNNLLRDFSIKGMYQVFNFT
jgi:hypothetical protein